MSQRTVPQTRDGVGATVPAYAWIILLAVFVASVAAPLNQNKVPPLMPVLIEALGITLSQGGLLMSVFSITGFILALPAGLILQRAGPRRTGLMAVGSLAVGAGLGAVSGTVGLLLVSRVVEGIGMGLIAVVAPAVIAMWFPADRQGTPMGIWATWVPVGSVLMMVVAPVMGVAYGWQSVWWLGAAFALAALLLFAALLRPPPAPAGSPTRPEPPARLGPALANRDIWLLALAFCCFNLVFMPLVTFFPTFLVQERGYSLADASLIAAVSTVLVLFSAPLAGWLSDRIRSRKRVFTLPFLAIAAMMLFPFRVSGGQIVALMALLGLAAGAVPTATFAAAPEVMRSPRLAGIGLAVVMLGQNLGMLAAPVLLGALVESSGWVAAGNWLIPAALLGFVAGQLVDVR